MILCIEMEDNFIDRSHLVQLSRIDQYKLWWNCNS